MGLAGLQIVLCKQGFDLSSRHIGHLSHQLLLAHAAVLLELALVLYGLAESDGLGGI